MITHRWSAIGTSVVVAVDDPGALPEVREVVAAEVAALDLACSRFRADSDLSRLNAAAGRPVLVSPLLAEAIRTALRAARLSGGAVDPTVGACMHGIGYDADFATLRDRGAASALPAAGWDRLQIDEQGLVTMPAGTLVDLGATAKALGADRAAAAAQRAIGGGVLVALGGDIAVSGPAPVGGWPVRVTDDHDGPPTMPGQDINIHSGGLATSSTSVRRWRRGGAVMLHIVDPRTGRPIEPVFRTASVAAGSCVDANTATTAALVRGRGAVDWLEAMGLPARLVTQAGDVLHLNGWPAVAEMAA